jgi:hypothetical protein
MILPSCSALQTSGALGTAVFWLRVLVGGVSVSATIYSIVLMSRTASGLWVKAVSPAALVICIFLLLCSVLCIASLLLLVLGIELISAIPDLWYYVVIVCSLACHALFAILMSFSTRSRADLYALDLEDYCIRRVWDAKVSEFLRTYGTVFSRRAFVNQRTSDQYPSIAAFIGIWLTATLALVVCTASLAERAPGAHVMARPGALRPGKHQASGPAAPSPGRAADDAYVVVSGDNPPDDEEPGESPVDSKNARRKRARWKSSGAPDQDAEDDEDGAA